MTLKEYRKKRRFDVTSEPSGDSESRPAPAKDLLYVIQKHQASHLHYDFRLEWNGVLLSWAVPKGPSLDPSVKRLAMQVEDHPLEYGNFEGIIPEGEYGGGTVMVWDHGNWTPESPDADAALKKGDLKFTLHGDKLKGSWVLVRTRGFGGSQRASWLLIKHRDRFASTQERHGRKAALGAHRAPDGGDRARGWRRCGESGRGRSSGFAQAGES